MNIYFWEIILSKKDKPFKQTGIDGGKICVEKVTVKI